MPFRETSQRMPLPRYHHLSKPRRALLKNIEELFGMFAVLGALEASTQMFLAVAPSAGMVIAIAIPAHCATVAADLHLAWNTFPHSQSFLASHLSKREDRLNKQLVP